MIGDPTRPLVVMALPQEGGALFESAQVPVLYTGVGKINAAYHLTLRLAEYRARNLPSAARRELRYGRQRAVRTRAARLVQHLRPARHGREPAGLRTRRHAIRPDARGCSRFPSLATHLPEAICGTGDSFATSHVETHFSVVDMEAYALAKVCLLQGARFGCIKFVTDGADDAAADAWQDDGRPRRRTLPRAVP